MVEEKVKVRQINNFAVLKYLKDCSVDVSPSWDIPESVLDNFLGSVTMISNFVGYLQADWSLKSSGITGYMNALGYLLDFRRRYSDLTKIHSSGFTPSEIYIQRVKRYLSKKNEIQLERSFEC